jgi:hypothetical protein
VGNLLVEPGEVKLVLNVVLVHLAEELIAAQAAEPGDPTHFLGTGHLALGRRIGGERGGLLLTHSLSRSLSHRPSSYKLVIFRCSTAQISHHIITSAMNSWQHISSTRMQENRVSVISTFYNFEKQN